IGSLGGSGGSFFLTVVQSWLGRSGATALSGACTVGPMTLGLTGGAGGVRVANQRPGEDASSAIDRQVAFAWLWPGWLRCSEGLRGQHGQCQAARAAQRGLRPLRTCITAKRREG